MLIIITLSYIFHDFLGKAEFKKNSTFPIVKLPFLCIIQTEETTSCLTATDAVFGPLIGFVIFWQIGQDFIRGTNCNERYITSTLLQQFIFTLNNLLKCSYIGKNPPPFTKRWLYYILSYKWNPPSYFLTPGN